MLQEDSRLHIYKASCPCSSEKPKRSGSKILWKRVKNLPTK